MAHDFPPIGPIHPAGRRPCPRTTACLAGWVLLVTYLSLFPFHFAVPPGIADPGTIITRAVRPGPPIDFIANVLLFAPVGLLAMLATRRTRPRCAIAKVIVGAGVLALSLQAAQVFLPARLPSLWDVAANMAGSVAGVAAGRITQRVAALRPGIAFTAIVLACGAAAQVIPGSPLTASGANFLLGGSIDWATSGALALHVAGWSAAVLWLRRAGPAHATAMVAAALLLVAVLLWFGWGPVPAGAAASMSAAGMGGGVLAGRLQPRVAAASIGVLLGGLIVFIALTPGTVAAVPARFHWWPLYGVLLAPPAQGLVVLLEKVFAYGLLYALMRLAGMRHAHALGLGCCALGVLEWLQRWSAGGHVSEITDPLLFALLALAASGGCGTAGSPQGLAQQMRNDHVERHAQRVRTDVE